MRNDRPTAAQGWILARMLQGWTIREVSIFRAQRRNGKAILGPGQMYYELCERNMMRRLVRRATLVALLRAGWIESTEEQTSFRITPAGRRAVPPGYATAVGD